MIVWVFLGGVWVLSATLVALMGRARILSFRWAPWLVCAMLFVLPFQFHLAATYEATIATLSAAFLCAVAMAKYAFGARLRPHIIWGPIILYIVVSVLSGLASDDWHVGFGSVLFFSLWAIVPFFAVVGNLETGKHLKWGSLALIGGGVAVSAYGLGIMLSDGGLLSWVEKLRLTPTIYYSGVPPVVGNEAHYTRYLYVPSEDNFGTFVNTDYFGAFLMAPLCFAAALLLEASVRKRWVYGVAALFIFLSLVLTSARGAMVGAVVGLTTILLTWMRKRSSAPLWMSLMVGALIIGTGLLLIGGARPAIAFVEKLPLIGEEYGPTNLALSLDLRREVWQVGWRIAVQRPWLGWGYEVGRDFGSFSFTHAHKWSLAHAHNWYLQKMIVSGALGLGAHLLVLGVVLVRSFRYAVRERGFEAGIALGVAGYLVAFMVDGIFNDSIRDWRNTMLFWSVIALSVVVYPSRGRQSIMSAGRRLRRHTLPPWAVVVGLVLLLGFAISLALAYLEEYLHIAIVPMALMMLGYCLLSLSASVAEKRYRSTR